MDIAALASNWWVLGLRGAVAVVFGVVTLFAPGISLAALILFFGSYAIVEGAFTIIAAIRARGYGDQPWWSLLFQGVVSVGAGVVTLAWPGLTALLLLYVIGMWAVVTGVLEIVAAFRLRKEITGEWRFVLSGILSIGFGALVMLAPGAGALAMVLWIGVYAVVFGALLIALAFRLRSAPAEERPTMQRRAA